MSHLFATAGARLYIGTAMDADDTDLVIGDFDEISDASPPDWIEIGGVTNLGSFGDTSTLIDSSHIASQRVRKRKGTRNAGAMSIVADLDYDDEGQLALIAAEKEKETYAFRVVFNDAPQGGTPSERLFVALVMTASEQLDEANNTMKLNASLEIDSNIVRVAAGA